MNDGFQTSLSAAPDPNRPDDNFMSNDRLLEGRRFDEAGNNDRSTSSSGHLQLVGKKLNNFRFERLLFKTPIGSPRPFSASHGLIADSPFNTHEEPCSYLRILP